MEAPSGQKTTDLAKATGVTKGRFSRLENGVRRMTTDWINKIAEALNITPIDLVSRPPNSPNGKSASRSKKRFTTSRFPIASVDPDVELMSVAGDQCTDGFAGRNGGDRRMGRPHPIHPEYLLFASRARSFCGASISPARRFASRSTTPFTRPTRRTPIRSILSAGRSFAFIAFDQCRPLCGRQCETPDLASRWQGRPCIRNGGRPSTLPLEGEGAPSAPMHRR